MGKRTGIQLCYPFEERRLLGQVRGQAPWSFPVLVQPKLDGERCRATVDEDGVHLWSSEANLIESVPHVNEALEEMDLPLALNLTENSTTMKMTFRKSTLA